MLRILHSINLNEYNINLDPHIEISEKDVFSFRIYFNTDSNLQVLIFYLNGVENFKVNLDKSIITARTS